MAQDKITAQDKFMAQDKRPILIKKYANRRLYHTGTSTYVTLDDLSDMVRKGEDFLVTDAKTNEDITRSVLTQIIFEEENRVGQGGNLLPIAFLRQLIRFYGDSMQAIVPKYLEFSIDRLTNDQQKFREQMSKTFGAPSMVGPAAFKALEEQARVNMAMFTDALRLFSPFSASVLATAAKDAPEKTAEKPNGQKELEEMKQQLAAMQAQLNKLDRKS